jgi:hypothetical protein
MRTVYAKAYWRLDTEDRSGMYWLFTETEIPLVTAVDMIE